MRASIITIGDELLIGQVVDTNSSWIARELVAIGIEMEEILSISDTSEAIKNAMDRAFSKSDLVLITGGLGPTVDDITKKSLNEYFDSEFYFDEAVYNRIQRLFTKLGREPLEAHRQQAQMPRKAKILENKMGTAPGMWFDHEGKIAISMPGVPYEMQSIMTHAAIPRIKELNNDFNILSKTICTSGMGESQIAEHIEHITNQFPPQLSIAFLPSKASVRLRLMAKGLEKEMLENLLVEKTDEIIDILGEVVYSQIDEPMETALGKLLVDKKLSLAFAESCTGGYLAHKITSIPGSSQFFLGSLVAYSNELKRILFAVRQETLDKYGAVSEETAKEMVLGCLSKTGADLAVSITGIAGPGGGSLEKPVGTIWIGIAYKQQIITKKLTLSKNRVANIEYTAAIAMNLLRKFVLNL